MSSNATCFHKHSEKEPPPLIQNGEIVFQTHHIGWIVTGAFAFLATAISLWLVNKHLRHYTNKHEQRYILRILFMVPIYSLVSFASYLFWNQSTPLLLLRDCYESTVLTSFFYLLLLYLSPDPNEQRAIFLKFGLSKENDRQAIRRGEPVKKWIFPLGSVKSKPADGLYFLQMMKWGVLQYCVIRPVTTLVAVILDYVGLYCEDSWSPGWGHVYIVTIVSISVSIAMYCLIQVYVPISKQLTPHRPILKLFAIKAVVFLTFWQATFLSVLSSVGVVKDTEFMTADDINIGIGAILETVEMTIFSVLHIRAFSYKPYLCSSGSANVSHSPTQSERLDYDDVICTPRIRSLLHAFNFRETLRELWEGFIFIVQKWKGVETDTAARRRVIRKDLFGGPHSRSKEAYLRNSPETGTPADNTYQPFPITINVEKEAHADSERQWIRTEDDYIDELPSPRRERSTGLEELIELELERRGLPSRFSVGIDSSPLEFVPARHDRKQQSWWRRTFDRISRASVDDRRNCGTSGEGAKETSRRGIEEYDKLPVNEVDRSVTPGYMASEDQLHDPFLAPDIVVSHSSENISVKTNSTSSLSSPRSRNAHDTVFSRLFVNKPNSEASGPSSQTHLSSHGQHIRLTAPAPIVPTDQRRALQRKPSIKSAVVSDRHSEMYPEKGVESIKEERRAVPTERRSRHCRESAHYEHSSVGAASRSMQQGGTCISRSRFHSADVREASARARPESGSHRVALLHDTQPFQADSTMFSFRSLN